MTESADRCGHARSQIYVKTGLRTVAGLQINNWFFRSARQLQLLRTTNPTHVYATNQMYTMGISNYFGAQSWNSYAEQYNKIGAQIDRQRERLKALGGEQDARNRAQNAITGFEQSTSAQTQAVLRNEAAARAARTGTAGPAGTDWKARVSECKAACRTPPPGRSWERS